MSYREDSNTIYVKELNLDSIAPASSQLGMKESFGGSKIIICGKPGCFEKGTPILLYNGNIKNVEDVIVGDILMGDDSTPRTVLELCHNRDMMYEIIPNKGNSYTVNRLHKLVLKSHKSSLEPIEMTVDEFLNSSLTFQKRMKIFKNPVNFPETPIELNPYDLGLWLGVEIESITSSSTLNDYLIKNNMLNNRFIPKQYKINSKENRLKLLAGILDSQSYFNTIHNGIVFKHASKQFFDDVVFIIRTLGLGTYNLENKEQFTCVIYGDNLTELPLKNIDINIQLILSGENHLETSFAVVPKKEDEYFGFTINGNHRFLLGSCDVVRNTGKSTLIASLLYGKKNIFPVAVAFSGSEDSNGFFKKIMPSTFIFNEYNEDQLRNVIKRQKIAKEHLPNPWAVIILDDCTDDARIFNTPLQQGIFKRGRHWSLFYIVSLQYCMDVKPAIRTNTDAVFILREPILRNRRSLWENFCSIIPDFNLFCTLMDELTEDFTAMVVINQSTTNDWKDCVFWYKAVPPPPDWKLGSEDYHRFHDERYNPDYIEPLD